MKEAEQFSETERENHSYDIRVSASTIFPWKAHILATVNQENVKQDLLQVLDNETAFIIVDFAMKFLTRPYRESMAN